MDPNFYIFHAIPWVLVKSPAMTRPSTEAMFLTRECIKIKDCSSSCSPFFYKILITDALMENGNRMANRSQHIYRNGRNVHFAELIFGKNGRLNSRLNWHLFLFILFILVEIECPWPFRNPPLGRSSEEFRSKSSSTTSTFWRKQK